MRQRLKMHYNTADVWLAPRLRMFYYINSHKEILTWYYPEQMIRMHGGSLMPYADQVRDMAVGFLAAEKFVKEMEL